MKDDERIQYAYLLQAAMEVVKYWQSQKDLQFETCELRLMEAVKPFLPEDETPIADAATDAAGGLQRITVEAKFAVAGSPASVRLTGLLGIRQPIQAIGLLNSGISRAVADHVEMQMAAAQAQQAQKAHNDLLLPGHPEFKR